MTTSNDNRRPLGSQPNHPSYSATSQPDRQQPQHSADSYQSDTIYEIVVSSPMKRFLHAFCVAFFIWFLLSVLLRSIYELAYWSHHHHGPYGNGYSYLISDYPVPDDVVLKECVSESGWKTTPDKPSRDYPYSSQTSFDVPLSSNVLSMITRGGNSAGMVHVVTSTDQAEDVATYHVVVNYFEEEIRNTAKVCSIRREDDEHGVGIFTHSPPFKGRKATIRFNTTIVLPVLEGDAPLSIKQFSTDLHYTGLSFADLGKTVLFESLLLQGLVAPVNAKAISFIKGKIQVDTAPIGGVFNTSKSLEIKTTDAPIAVHVGLTHKDDGPGPHLVLETNNAPIVANVSLLTTSEQPGGSYNIRTTTSNAPLKVSFPTSPVDSALEFYGSTSNNPAEVSLHSAYQGSFSIATSLFGASVIVDHNVEDPSGRGRQRNVVISEKHISNKASGEVWWGKERTSKGTVHLETSILPVVLRL